MKLLFCISLFVNLVSLNVCGQTKLPRLFVEKDSHILMSEKKGNLPAKPFFWLGDTAWELFAALDEKETIQYLDNRAEKKFTVIQAHLLAWKIQNKNAFGETAFQNQDFDHPNERYWKHVDFVLGQAAKKGLYMALLPAWCAEYIEPQRSPMHTDSSLAYRYARFLGQRYRGYSNIIWVLGGDKLPAQKSIYRSLAKGLTETYGGGDSEKIMITYHPPGGTNRPPATSSGEFFHNENWLDMNMIQSGHARDNASYQRIAEDYSRKPVKPTLDAEPCYEQHPVKHNYKNGAFGAWDLRRRGYWSLFAGACGFTYGGNGIWQMDKPGRVGQSTHFKDYWYDAINYEGGGQMRHLRTLAEKYQWHTWVPDSSLIDGPPGFTDDRIQAARTSDGATILYYTTNGRTITTGNLPAGQWVYKWFDPRNGEATKPKKVVSSILMPPTSGNGADWVLVLSAYVNTKK